MKSHCDVHVIYTFYTGPQSQALLNIRCETPKKMSEKQLLDGAFAKLRTPQLAQLMKLSFAFQNVHDEGSLPHFIRTNRGKYYFNVETNVSTPVVDACLRKLRALRHRRLR